MAKGESAAPPVLARLFPDLPVDDGEELQFEFEGPARTLAELALNPDNRTPFTVVVKGGWGRGKTTLLLRAKWLLEHPDEVAPAGARRQVETLWFNAWKYPCEDTVLAGLLGALLDKLHKGKLGEQLKVLIDSYKGSLVGKVLYLAAPAPVKDLFGGEGLRSRFSPVSPRSERSTTPSATYSARSHGYCSMPPLRCATPPAWRRRRSGRRNARGARRWRCSSMTSTAVAPSGSRRCSRQSTSSSVYLSRPRPWAA